jgi:hypothetical protein
MQRCIYCLEEKDVSAFNRDHVLPEALGTFRDNLPRLDCVCHACNQYFGDHIELIFHRGSVEAIHRILTGLKSPQEVNRLRRDRLSFPSEHRVNGMGFASNSASRGRPPSSTLSLKWGSVGRANKTGPTLPKPSSQIPRRGSRTILTPG